MSFAFWCFHVFVLFCMFVCLPTILSGYFKLDMSTLFTTFFHWTSLQFILPESCSLAATDLVFVVDASTSVTEANFKKQLDFMKSIVKAADIDSGITDIMMIMRSEGTNDSFYKSYMYKSTLHLRYICCTDLKSSTQNTTHFLNIVWFCWLGAVGHTSRYDGHPLCMLLPFSR